MRRYRINEAIVEDPDFVEKIKKFAELSDKIDEITANLKSLKREYDDIEVHIRPILEELKITKDNALQVENILITIKRAGGDKKNIKYKEAFEWLYSKVNAQMKAIIDESIQKNMTISRVASSISVQKLSENKLRKSLTSAVGRITSLLKPFISFLSKKNQEINKTITDFKSKFKMDEAISETKIQPNGTMVGMRGFSPMNESKNKLQSLIKRIIKEEKNNLTKNRVVRITESQLKNQVKKMLREYDDDGYDMDDIEKYPERYPQGETFERDAEEIELPNGALVFYDWSAEEDSSGKQEHSWEIKNVEYYPNKNDDTKYYNIDIYDPKYADILKMIDKNIMEWLDGQGWNREYDDPKTYHQREI
jgi:hypothetical protein